MDHAKAFIEKEKFGGFVGIELYDVLPGSARAKVSLKNHHMNGLSTAHGGLIFTLADIAFAAASNAGGTSVASINASINYTKASTGGTIYAEAKEISRSSRLVTYEVLVRDEHGEILASFQGLGYSLRSK